MDSRSKFSKVTVLLHWTIALAMIGMLAFGLYLDDMPRSAEKGELMGLHKSIGVIVLVFAAYRLFHRLYNKLPQPLTPMPAWQQLSARAAHIFLLAGTLFMPVSGLMMSIGGGRAVEVFGVQLLAAGDKTEWLKELGGAIHGTGSTLLMIVLALHLLAVCKHHFIDKDGTLKRMLGQKVNAVE